MEGKQNNSILRLNTVTVCAKRNVANVANCKKHEQTNDENTIWRLTEEGKSRCQIAIQSIEIPTDYIRITINEKRTKRSSQRINIDAVERWCSTCKHVDSMWSCTVHNNSILHGFEKKTCSNQLLASCWFSRTTSIPFSLLLYCLLDWLRESQHFQHQQRQLLARHAGFFWQKTRLQIHTRTNIYSLYKPLDQLDSSQPSAANEHQRYEAWEISHLLQLSQVLLCQTVHKRDAFSFFLFFPFQISLWAYFLFLSTFEFAPNRSRTKRRAQRFLVN